MLEIQCVGGLDPHSVMGTISWLFRFETVIVCGVVYGVANFGFNFGCCWFLVDSRGLCSSCPPQQHLSNISSFVGLVFGNWNKQSKCG